jgi:CpeS-like protein
MNALNFFTLNKGKWITQRTIYNIQTDAIYTHKSDINIYPEIDITNKKKIDLLSSNKQFNLYIDDSFDENICSVAIQDTKQSCNISKIKKIANNIEHCYLIYINSINYISLAHKIGKLKIFETVWFVNSNLRLSVSLVQKNNKCILTSFNSDIKINS